VEPHLRARLYVFDVLRLDGTDITTRTFAERRTMLEELAEDWSDELVLTVCSDDPQALWDLVVEHRMEGVIAKRSTGRYRPGPVAGLDQGQGGAHRDLPGRWGHLGRRRRARASRARSTSTSSTATAPWCTWATARPASVRDAPGARAAAQAPPLIVEVEYSQVTTGRVLRHPGAAGAAQATWACSTAASTSSPCRSPDPSGAGRPRAPSTILARGPGRGERQA
jgi:hypothetical protein